MAYLSPAYEKTFYYYRDNNNHIVEVIIDRNNKASFRVYDYKPKFTDNSAILAHIPNMGSEKPVAIFNDEYYKPSATPKVESFSTSENFVNGHYSSSIHTDVVPRDGALKFIPKDITLYDGNGAIGFGKTKMLGKLSSAVAKGHVVEFSVVSGEDSTQDAIIRYTAATSVEGKFKNQKIVIPLSLNIGSNLMAQGEISDTRTAGTVNEKKLIMQFFEPAIEGQRPRTEYVTVNVSQQVGQPVMYDLQRNFVTDSSTFMTTAGKAPTGGYIGVGVSPNKNPNGESVQIRFVDEDGHVAGYATYSRVF